MDGRFLLLVEGLRRFLLEKVVDFAFLEAFNRVQGLKVGDAHAYRFCWQNMLL